MARFLGGTWRSRSGITGVVGDLRRWGNGSRAIVLGLLKPGARVGHYFNVIKDNDKIAFIDVQQGVAWHLDNWDGCLVMRRDNL
ncbi:toxin glutamine deamidase domain-containing protein [Streptomyces dubilierae]|uniref:toxin glutamine deamidase domain-containing protein n=1 Tax=Streptomyces dubilierae TaxID=3075533 RepID=UPI00374DFCAD